MEERTQKFKAKVAFLNRQFSQYVSREVEKKPDKLLSGGCADYVRHGAKIRFEYEDIFVDEDESGESGGIMKHGRTTNLLALSPLVQTKTVHLIRHGEGFHNIGISKLDSNLTGKGWAQAHGLGDHIKSCVDGIELVISSPLTRALETAAGAFGMGQGQNILMEKEHGIMNTQTAHDTLFCIPGTRYIVHELCRERLGPSNCDARREKSLLQQRFPGFDFSLITSEKDAMWIEGDVESESSVAERGIEFLRYVMSQPEKNIAVITHSAFLWFTLAMFGGDCSRGVRDKMQKWFENGEMRSMVLIDGADVNSDDTYHFDGSVASNEPQQALMES
jgi:broad specificity phosphatase PhoE